MVGLILFPTCSSTLYFFFFAGGNGRGARTVGGEGGWGII